MWIAKVSIKDEVVMRVETEVIEAQTPSELLVKLGEVVELYGSDNLIECHIYKG